MNQFSVKILLRWILFYFRVSSSDGSFHTLFRFLHTRVKYSSIVSKNNLVEWQPVSFQSYTRFGDCTQVWFCNWTNTNKIFIFLCKPGVSSNLLQFFKTFFESYKTRRKFKYINPCIIKFNFEYFVLHFIILMPLFRRNTSESTPIREWLALSYILVS